ncbi:TetR/AcrR family transcriptional regulator [Ruegeria atlantica]|uniref:TetR/AcrR family transcriptional regulator n=1 Tax=Ruegeria atlantica TaxID=81569 RepID=UPI00147B5972|nr:TetR/AcrR family transcriptional regulator [Ruegeria atlantica]
MPVPKTAVAKRDAEVTRKNILEAATIEFSEKGFAGARVDLIASRSGANKNMLYHYFGNKEALFTAVLENAYGGLRARQRAVKLGGLSPEDALHELGSATFDAFVEMPHLIRLLNSENLLNGVHAKQSDLINEMYDPLFAALSTVLEDGVKAGCFRPGIDPTNLYISMASLVYHYVSNHATLEIIVKRDLMSDENLRARKAHVLEMILRFCTSKSSLAS